MLSHADPFRLIVDSFFIHRLIPSDTTVMFLFIPTHVDPFRHF